MRKAKYPVGSGVGWAVRSDTITLESDNECPDLNKGNGVSLRREVQSGSWKTNFKGVLVWDWLL